MPTNVSLMCQHSGISSDADTRMHLAMVMKREYMYKDTGSNRIFQRLRCHVCRWASCVTYIFWKFLPPYTRTHTCTHMYAHLHTHTHSHTLTHTLTCTHTHTCTHTLTHTKLHSCPFQSLHYTVCYGDDNRFNDQCRQ